MVEWLASRMEVHCVLHSNPCGIYIFVIKYIHFGNILFESSFNYNVGWGGGITFCL